MKGLLQITFLKLKGFRLNKACAVMLIAVVARTVMVGESIWLTGVCAAIVPFISQARRWPKSPAGTADTLDSLSTFLMDMLLMFVYLGMLVLLTMAASYWLPFYVPDPRFLEKFALVFCADVVFISALSFVGCSLDVSQRMQAGIVLCNGELGFSFIMTNAVDAGLLDGCFVPAAVFCAIVVTMALVLMRSNGANVKSPSCRRF